MKRLVFLVGASGVGKSTVAEVLEKRAPWRGNTHYFDTIGVPSAGVLESEFGGGEEWQRWATHRWVERLMSADSPLQLLEGQTRPSFIMEAAKLHPEVDPCIVLLDCTSEVRRQRLVALRQQPELATAQMDSWAAYLTGQAHALELPVVDTTHANPQEVASEVESRLGIVPTGGVGGSGSPHRDAPRFDEP